MKEPIRKYLKKIVEKWNKYEEFGGTEALSFKNDIEMLLTYWNERVVTEKEIRVDERKKTLEEVKKKMEEHISKKILWFNPYEHFPNSIQNDQAVFMKDVEEMVKEVLSKLKV